MKPPQFSYLRAETIAEALAALHAHGDEARVLAGGQSLLPMLNMRLTRPAVLVDIMRLDALAQITLERETLTVGASVRQGALLGHRGLAGEVPLLAKALPFVGHYQTRARGTICGSVAHADPSAEIPLCLVALGGEVRLRNRRKRRSLPAEAFFTALMATAKDEDEMIEAVTFPTARDGTGYAFAEVGRRHGDFAIVACAAIADAKQMRLAIGGVGDRPIAHNFPLLEADALDDALNQFAWDLDARDDLHATARYRRDLVRKLGRKVLEEASACRN